MVLETRQLMKEMYLRYAALCPERNAFNIITHIFNGAKNLCVIITDMSGDQINLYPLSALSFVSKF